MAEATKSCDFCHFLKMQEFEVASDIKVKVDVTKGSLISESFSLWLKSPKKWRQITFLSIFPLVDIAQKSHLRVICHFFSEI